VDPDDLPSIPDLDIDFYETLAEVESAIPWPVVALVAALSLLPARLSSGD
jgi:hypothetical protein